MAINRFNIDPIRLFIDTSPDRNLRSSMEDIFSNQQSIESIEKSSFILQVFFFIVDLALLLNLKIFDFFIKLNIILRE